MRWTRNSSCLPFFSARPNPKYESVEATAHKGFRVRGGRLIFMPNRDEISGPGPHEPVMIQYPRVARGPPWQRMHGISTVRQQLKQLWSRLRICAFKNDFWLASR